MKKVTIILTTAALLLGVVAAVLWLSGNGGESGEGYSYGVSEGLQLTVKGDGSLVVRDAKGGEAFPIPLRGCLVDTRFRGGKLRFREKATGREGYVDRYGVVTFYGNSPTLRPEEARQIGSTRTLETQAATPSGGDAQATGGMPQAKSPQQQAATIGKVDIRSMARSNPFYGEASKIMQGKLDEKDAKRRQLILNYCEHFRTAYTTKDIDFLRQVFSDKALIIVGNVVKTKASGDDVGGDRRVSYALHTKADYLARLEKVFGANKRIDMRFSDFHIMRHPTRDGIYGVTLRQRYKSDRMRTTDGSSCYGISATRQCQSYTYARGNLQRPSTATTI